MDHDFFENELDKDTKLLISKMEKELESKDKEINDLKNELDYLKRNYLIKIERYLGNIGKKSSKEILKKVNTIAY
jgi:predicted RNase H-like nuclease (RuvC/YqgF family)